VDPRPWLTKATAGNPADEIDNPSVSVDGKIVAFEAYGSFQNSFSGGASFRRQIFVVNRETNQVLAVTGDSRGDSIKPSLSENGTVLVFESTAPLLAGVQGVSQIFVYSLVSGELWQVTNGMGPSRNPMTNRVASYVTFESTAALKGDGHDTGISQIFVWAKGSGVTFQMTEGNADSRNPYLDERSLTQVYFESEATDLPGTLSGPGTQIYRAVIRDGELPFIEQMTFGPGDCTHPAVDPAGGRIVFIGTGDILENGTFGDRLFAMDISDPVWILYQITKTGTVAPPVGASLGTWFTTFVSNQDIAGTGGCGNQLFLVDYDPDHYVTAGRIRFPSYTPGRVPVEPEPGNPDDACTDVNRCTTDSCLGGVICDHDLRPDGSQCANGDVCSGAGTCSGGFCQVTGALDCNDEDACTTDACNVDAGGCQHATKDCSDADPCTNDLCDALEGCLHVQKEDFEGLDCRADVVPSPPNDKRVTRALTRALRMVAGAKAKSARGAIRRLNKADSILKGAVARIADLKSISDEDAQKLVAAITDLVNQIRAVVLDLQRQITGGKTA
jgi:Tol biopolymer transport system component